MITKRVYAYAILFQDVDPLLQAIVACLPPHKLANPMRLELSKETAGAIDNLINCRSTVDQVSSYIDTKVLETMQALASVEGLIVDRVVL